MRCSGKRQGCLCRKTGSCVARLGAGLGVAAGGALGAQAGRWARKRGAGRAGGALGAQAGRWARRRGTRRASVRRGRAADARASRHVGLARAREKGEVVGGCAQACDKAWHERCDTAAAPTTRPVGAHDTGPLRPRYGQACTRLGAPSALAGPVGGSCSQFGF